MATLLTLPLEILDAIAFSLTSLQPLGPPSILLPLLLTCKHTHALLSPSSNPGLHARIFRHKFDSAPVRRRAFTPTPQQYVDQLVRYCTALKVLRRGSVYVGCVGDVWGVRGERDEEGMGWGVGSLGEALMVGVVMMMEDEGRNVRQLVQWAGADGFVDGYVRGRLYDGAHGNNGWPVENEENACALWLMWLLTTEERLYNETPAERQQMLELLQPIVTMPYRYPVGEIPPQHYTLPLPSPSSHLLSQPTTIPTLHGPYPPYPSPTTRLISRSYYATRPVLSTPLISSAARLLYFARTEVVPLGIPQHFARDRREAWAQGRKEIGPTREDVEEFNWGWMVRLPLGRGVWMGNRGKEDEGRVGWRWGVGDVSPLHAPNDDDDEDMDLTTISVAPGPSPFPNPHPPHPRWAGKAPHSKSLAMPHRSRKWDADWWRLRLCGDPARRQPRVPIGRVYEPGCMDGLWQGLMMTPSEASIQALLNTALHPPHGTEFTERTMTRPVYMRLSELHGVLGALSSSSSSSSASGSSPPSSSGSSSSSTPSSPHRRRKRTHRPHTPNEEEHPFAHVHDGEGEGMNNAWFAGTRPPTVRALEDGLIELAVDGVGTGVYRRWIGVGAGGGGGGGGRLGNDAFPSLGSRSALEEDKEEEEEEEEEEEGEEFEGYEHDYARCTRCAERRRLVKRVRERQARIRERAFGGVGLGMAGDGGSGSSRSTSASSAGGSSDEDMDVDTDEENLDEWDEWDEDMDGAGRAHDVLKRVPPLRFGDGRNGDGEGERCDGVREIVLVGETDPTHSHAFNPYTFHGRIRPYDGLIGIIRSPHPNPRQHFNSPSYPYPDVHIGQETQGGGGEGLLFYGYLVGGDNFVGSWRVVSEDMGVGTPVWEGAFCLGRRED